MNKVNKLSKHPKLCKKNIIFWIWQNELHNFLEDLAYWPQSVILIAVFFIFTSISIGIIEVYPSMHGSMFLASNLFSGILIVLIAGRYVYTSVSQESGSYWIMRSGPISLFGWMLRKFSIYFILFAGFGSASVIFYLKRLRADKIIIGVSLMNIIVLALFITSLGYLYGVIFIDFKENDVWLIASNTGGIIFLISGFLSVVIISISYILPLLIPGKTPEIGFLANITGIYILLVYIIFRYATELLRRKDLG